MMIATKFDIGDVVKCGPHIEARITRIIVGMSLTYIVSYWVDGHPCEYTAYDWELSLVEKAEDANV
jgi:hypothetical protein